MPVFNAGEFLRPAIESVRAQTFEDFELIIVDDGSTDYSAKTIRDYSGIDRRVCGFFERNNRGISETRNFALAQARGGFIAFLNHDDVALPNRLARQLDFLEQNENIDLVGSAIENIDAASSRLDITAMPESDLEIHWLGLLDCPIRQSALMARRQLFDSIRYDPNTVSYSDYDFVSRAIRVRKAANLPDVLTQYRKHPRNTSRVRWEMFVSSGARIANDAIGWELPSFPIEPEAVAELRAVILGYQLAGTTYPLAAIKRAVRMYMDLFEAFVDKHRDHALLARLRRPNGAEFFMRKNGDSNQR